MNSGRMIRIIFTAVLWLTSGMLFAQTVPPGGKKLTEAAVQQLFADSIKKRLGIKYNVYAVFEYTDSKQQYLVLSEKMYSKEKDKTSNDSIQAVILWNNKGLLQPLFTITDFITPGKNVKGFTDYSIWFWTKYISIADIDGDGMADPIIVYGTAGDNEHDDGKIKIITWYKGKKYVIRQQNSGMDFDRNTNIDKLWYTLPAKIQAKIKSMMKVMMDNGHAIFPAGWEKAMAAKRTYFDEN
jgi:hypothetical protein